MRNIDQHPRNASDEIREYLERNPEPVCNRRGYGQYNRTGKSSWAAMARTGNTPGHEQYL